SVLTNLSANQHTSDRVSERIGRSIVNDLKKANKQLAAHAEQFARKNLVRMLLLINEDHGIYDPQTVFQVVSKALWRHESGSPLYPNVDSVLYLTERHAAVVRGQVTFPLIFVHGTPVEHMPWKKLVFDYVVHKWELWSGRIVMNGHNNSADFST